VNDENVIEKRGGYRARAVQDEETHGWVVEERVTWRRKQPDASGRRPEIATWETVDACGGYDGRDDERLKREALESLTAAAGEKEDEEA
jgi:hypothetical protein